MNPNYLGKPVILSLLEGGASGTLVGYTYLANPTVDVQVGDRVFRNLDPNQVRLANGVHFALTTSCN